MKKKRLFYGILALISFQAWGMDDIRAMNILKQLPGKRAIVQEAQSQLRGLGPELSKLLSEVAVIDDLQAQLKIAEGEVASVKAVGKFAKGDEVDRTIMALTDANYAVSSFSDNIKKMKLAIGPLGRIKSQIAAIQRQEDDALDEIDNLMQNLREIHPDVVREGLNLIRQRPGGEQEVESIQAALKEARSVRAQTEAARAAARRKIEQDTAELVAALLEAARRQAAGGVAPLAAAASAAAPQFTIGRKTTGAIITAITIAIATYIGTRIYQKKKNRLIRKYKLTPFTDLQNSVWRAIALAHIRMPWYLQYLIKNNKGTVSDFLGSNPLAAAELYYGRTASEADVQRFIQRFFGGIK